MNAVLPTDFDEFLFASIGEDASGMPLTLLSVLARLGVDPWEEAAALAHLPVEPATQRLAARLEALPHGPTPDADTVTLATRLIALLHRPRKSKAHAPKAHAPEAQAPEAQLPKTAVRQPRQINVAYYYLAGLILLLVAQWALASLPVQAPANITLVPQLRQ